MSDREWYWFVTGFSTATLVAAAILGLRGLYVEAWGFAVVGTAQAIGVGIVYRWLVRKAVIAAGAISLCLLSSASYAEDCKQNEPCFFGGQKTEWTTVTHGPANSTPTMCAGACLIGPPTFFREDGVGMFKLGPKAQYHAGCAVCAMGSAQ